MTSLSRSHKPVPAQNNPIEVEILYSKLLFFKLLLLLSVLIKIIRNLGKNRVLTRSSGNTNSMFKPIILMAFHFIPFVLHLGFFRCLIILTHSLIGDMYFYIGIVNCKYMKLKCNNVTMSLLYLLYH